MTEASLLQRLRAAREAGKLTQADVAASLGQTPMKVSHLENGLRALRVRDALAYAKAIGQDLRIELRAAQADPALDALADRAARALAALPPDQRETEVMLLEARAGLVTFAQATRTG